MSEENQEVNSKRIKTLFGSKNKRSEIWKYFGHLWSNDIKIDDLIHCILCYDQGKLPVK